MPHKSQVTIYILRGFRFSIVPRLLPGACLPGAQAEVRGRDGPARPRRSVLMGRDPGHLGGLSCGSQLPGGGGLFGSGCLTLTV